MKVFYALMVGFILMMALSSVALSKDQHGSFILTRVVIIDDYDLIVASVAVENDLETEFSDGKIVVSIPELGLRAAKNVHLRNRKHDTNNVFLDVPEDVPTGEYYLRVAVMNDDVTRIRHRLITFK